MTFYFKEWIGEFVAYFSLKHKVPNQENGYQQKFENKTVCVFPQQHVNAKPGMIRIPKNQILYVTLECTETCQVSISMTQNKKTQDTIPDFSAVLDQAKDKKAESKSPVKRSLKEVESDENEQSQQALLTLNKMLGGDEDEEDANKANKILRKKIKYMLEDMDVADEFLSLVD